MTGRRSLPDVGSVFVIPLPSGRFAVAQVLAADSSVDITCAVFEAIVSGSEADQALKVAASAGVALVGATMNAEFRTGRWAILGVQPPRLDLPLPAYTVGVGFPLVPWLLDFDGRRIRPLEGHEVGRLEGRLTSNPTAFEHAVRALHGEAKWVPLFDRLHVEKFPRRDEFGTS